MARSFESTDLVSGLATFMAYAAGMGVLLGAVTVALSLAKGGFVRHLRHAQPHINRVSGALLVVAGLYLAYYGYWEIRVLDDPTNPPPSGVVDAVNDLGYEFRDWITSVGAERIGIALVAAIAVAVVLAVGLRKPTSEPTPPAAGS